MPVLLLLTLTVGFLKGPFLDLCLQYMCFLFVHSQFIQNQSVSHHCYADDTQLYVPLQSNNPRKLDNLLVCIKDIKCWMINRGS